MVSLENIPEEPRSISTPKDPTKHEICESPEPDSISWNDDESTASPEDDRNSCLDIAEDQPGIYGNIVVKNSQDVHFGNKTFYQGPVTIKQFLYNNANNGELLCIGDKEQSTSDVCENSENGINFYGNSDSKISFDVRNKEELTSEGMCNVCVIFIDNE